VNRWAKNHITTITFYPNLTLTICVTSRYS